MMCPKCGRNSITVREGFDLDSYIATCDFCNYRKEYKGDHYSPQYFLKRIKEEKENEL